MKRDAYNFKGKWESWKETNSKGIQGIIGSSHKVLMDFLNDQELGMNTPPGMNGRRSPGTLLNLAQHNLFFLEHYKKPITEVTKKNLHKLYDDVITGKIQRKRGGKFTQFGNYIKDHKVFWKWMVRTKRVNEDITEDLSAKTTKPAWVYLDENQIKTFFSKLSFDMRAICLFMYDSGARVTEANSIKIENFSDDYKKVTIPEDAAKTFERTINLKLSSNILKEYVKEHNLKPNDYLFQKNLWAMNKYLKFNCGKIFGKDKVSHPKSKGKYGSFTLYDIRHNAACYWLNRYPTAKGLMFRLGWKRPDKIDYYTNFLGIKDEILDTDMIVGEDKDKLLALRNDYDKQSEDIEDLRKGMDYLKKEILRLGKLKPKS